jgi:hypothetical protein
LHHTPCTVRRQFLESKLGQEGAVLWEQEVEEVRSARSLLSIRARNLLSLRAHNLRARHLLYGLITCCIEGS